MRVGERVLYREPVQRDLYRPKVRRLAAIAFVFGGFAIGAQAAAAAPPATPTIIEPSFDNEVLSAADVHMEANGYSDPDGDPQGCSDWAIWTAPADPGIPEKIWHADCVPSPLNVHIHLGDGEFIGSYDGNSTLEDDTDYVLHATFHDDNGDASPEATRPFSTYPPNPPGDPEHPWVVKQPDYVVQQVAGGLRLPVDIAFVPHPGADPGDPLLYVTELYGTIKVVTRDGHVSNYATNLLNFDPTGPFPGSGEQGVTGITVDPKSGDVFASALYAASSKHYGEVLRFHSTNGGLTASSRKRILSLFPDPTGPSHQISNLTIGPSDGKLYVHVGDGLAHPDWAQEPDHFLGKILRVNLDGTPVSSNPFYGAYSPADYVVAEGFRNPFGGAWRAANGAHYEVENGPDNNDRLAEMFLPSAGIWNFGWDGTAESMRTDALYNWSPPHAPTNIAFTQCATFKGSGFPASDMDEAYVAESGPTYASGPQALGKRIVEFDHDSSGEFGSVPATPLVEYNGVGHETVVGLAAGPDGLYFTDLYKDDGDDGSARGANLWRVKYVGSGPFPTCPNESSGPGGGGGGGPSTPAPTSSQVPQFDLKSAKKRCKKKSRGKARKKCVKRAKAKARAL